MKHLLSLLLFVGLLNPITALAYTNTFSTTLVSASTQFWSITNAAQTGLSITGNLTACGYYKFTTLGTNFDYVLMTKDLNTGNQSYDFEVYQTGGSDFLYWESSATGAGAVGLQVAWTPSTATWYQLCAVYTASGGSVSFWVNGSQQGATQTGAPASIFNGNAPFRIGATSGGGAYLNGQVDDAMIWSSALTSGQISTLHSSQCVVPSPTPVSRWLFDNNGNDSIGSNNLTNNNAATFTTDVPYVCAAANSFNFGQFFPF